LKKGDSSPKKSSKKLPNPENGFLGAATLKLPLL